jgi:hypothetical protein
MKRNVTKIALIGILAALLFLGCKDFWHPEGPQNGNGNNGGNNKGSQNDNGNNGGNNNGGNPFYGTWYGTWSDGGNQPLILIFQESFYSWTLPDGGGWGFSGSYTYSGNFATLYGDMPGTAEIQGSNLILTCGYFGGNNQVTCRK